FRCKKARINGLFYITLCTIKSKSFFKLLILFRIWRKRRDSNSKTDLPQLRALDVEVRRAKSDKMPVSSLRTYVTPP
ncbi:type II secretion system protein GspI, partial [Klebsiella michiganensis]|uniref:type II secretion system protein GspI n=1 Tax=Klebsiella michiganensis TaxID=1134687 RepID=UPI001E3D4258